MQIRERTEMLEKQYLSSLASLSCENSGRLQKEDECSVRTAYQRDRDRILHSKAFRRLKHKTQVFLSPEGDHYRTRLTHTLETSQIARTIARALLLNEDLTEAIALGHDLGHTPFGHAGESVLNEIYPLGFLHYEQSLRVVDKLEKDGRGLNLTLEVRNGIERHTCGEPAQTLEGQVVRLADRIAYVNHDIDDAIRGNVLSEDDLPRDVLSELGNSHSARVNMLILEAVSYGSREGKIGLGKRVQQAFDALYRFMFESVYTNKTAKKEETKTKGLIEGLYSYYKKHPDLMQELYCKIAEREGIDRAVCDYIAGMSDRFAVQKYMDLYIPKSWQ